MKGWQARVIQYAAEEPTASYAALARWVDIHSDTLRKSRKSDPSFDQALQDARQRKVTGGDAVDIETFIRDPRYLGLGVKGQDENGSVLPNVLREAQRIIEGQYSIVLMTGALGSGKTFTAALCLTYIIYRLLLLSNPHQKLGLDANSVILFAIQSQTQKKARANDFALIRSFITGSKWFMTHAPINERTTSKIVFLNRMVEVWPAGPNPEEVIGMNCFAGILDETNFYERVQNSTRAIHGRDFDQARSAFESLLRRQQSRFDQGNAGPIFIVSSKRYAGQFTDTIYEDFKDSESLYVFDHTTWSIDPDRYARSKWFRMFVGDRTRPPRIVADDEVTPPDDDKYIISIPEDLKRSFKRDPVGCLQEHAGHSTQVYGGFFCDMEALHGAATLEQTLFRSFDVVGDATLLLLNPDAITLEHGTSPRHAHLDLALSNDNAAIGIGHITRYDDNGLPVIYCDALARVRPPEVGQIRLDSFYALIQALIRCGIPIQSVSADGFQSVDLMQRLQRLGLRAGRISADQTTVSDPMQAFESLRNAVNEGRFFFPADDETVEDMQLLQIDYSASRGFGKVDHLPGRKKDTADCLAVISFYLTHHIKPWMMAGKIEGAGFAAAINQPTLGGVSFINNPGVGADIIPLLRAQRFDRAV